MKNNYDSIAVNYDWLSRLIFRQSLILSQTCLLKHIPAGSNMLIVGGGTGWILEEISKVHASGLSITYVELSEKMTLLARKRCAGKNQIIFVNKAIEDFSSKKKYDIIFTAFLFDNFGFDKAQTIFQHLNHLLNGNGKWLFADFYLNKNSKSWQKLMLKSMIFFFRVICNIEARDLIPIGLFFEENGFNESVSHTHYHGFVKSSVYIRLDFKS